MARGSTDDNDKASTGQAYEVIKADENLSSLEVEGKTYDFKRVHGSMFRVRDRGMAMAIRDRYGRGRNPQVTVTKVAYPDIRDRGHKYLFSVPELPWHKGKQNGKAKNEEKEEGSGDGYIDQLRWRDQRGTAPGEEEKER